MGGRKSYSTKDIIGNMRKVATERKELSAALKSESPNNIVKATVGIVSKSENAVSNLSNIIEMRGFFDGISKAKLTSAEVESKASKYWVKKKQKEKIIISHAVERSLIRATVKGLKQRGEK